MDIGHNIKKFRKYKNWTQKQLANECGLSKNAIWNYENKNRIPTIETVNKIADALHVSLNELNKFEYNIYEEAVETFGINSRIDLCIEEMSELTQALCKYKRGLLHNVEEEMVDVGIMLEQLKLIFNPHMIKGYKYSKIERLRKTIEDVHKNEI
jgi:transcriptional regulator with XRE-family HTH domain